MFFCVLMKSCHHDIQSVPFYDFLIFFFTRCVMMADILKPAKHAASEMLEILKPDLKR